MSINSNFNPDQLRAVGTKNPSRFAAGTQSRPQVILTPNTVIARDMAEIEAAEDTVNAARYDAGEVGADPEFWRRQREMQKLVSAPADRDLTNAEQKGWDTVNADPADRPLHPGAREQSGPCPEHPGCLSDRRLL